MYLFFRSVFGELWQFVAKMGHGAAASLSVEGSIGAIPDNSIPQVDVEKMPLLSPYQLGPFKLSHRFVVFDRES